MIQKLSLIPDVQSSLFSQSNSRIFPDTFKKEMLLPYQQEGLRFLQKAGSSILGDQMGLGKTPQALALAESLGLHTLILCPAALRHQWASEISKFTSSTCSIIAGSAKVRQAAWGHPNDHYKICGYDTLRGFADLDAAKTYCKAGLVIYDEITKLKNWKAQRTKAISTLQPYFKIGLTGTPIENSLPEFYQIFRIVAPSLLGSYVQFSERYLIIEEQGNRWHRWKEVVGTKNLDILKEKIAPKFLRRERDEVLDLPPTSDVVLRLEATKEQRTVEKSLLKLARANQELVLACFVFAQENTFNPAYIPIEKIQDIDLHEIIRFSQKDQSQKLIETVDLLQELAPHKVIVFSKFEKVLSQLQRMLPEEISYLHGGVDTEQEFEKWDADQTRVLAMTQMGTYGLNLQSAHFMVMLDKPYNPAVIEQLKARIHRMGQKEAMTFYDLQTDLLIEKRINQILSEKRNLSASLLAKEVMK
jgi:SNF2 family DNA or RNA helicase